ncbi:MAG: hypothetical protein KJP18_01780 [Gemmatimonadetes bacterium]|nr:hypothetical protein [Gemmatimonadota bacterium]
MAPTELVLFDDARARRWSPFVEARPVGELRFGDRLLRERVEAVTGLRCTASWSGPGLEGWDEPEAPPCRAVPTEPLAHGLLLWSSRVVPLHIPDLPNEGTLTFTVEDAVVGWRLGPGDDIPPESALADPEQYRIGTAVDVQAEVLGWPWTLVDRFSDRLRGDLEARAREDEDPGELPGVHRIGAGPLAVGPDVEIGPGVILDLRDGPIRLDAGVRIEGPARLVGPLHLGPGCVVFGGHVSRVAAGPVCKLRGEIADSVFVGYANKAHDGYLGHALVGRWVNLGAGTSNSDLKNSYGNVRVQLPRERISTNLMKVGVFLGDHVKTGIGTLLTTGGVVGAGSNVFGGGPAAPRYLPAFSWSSATGVEPFRFDKFVEVAQAAMARRGKSLTPGVEDVLRRLRAATHESK